MTWTKVDAWLRKAIERYNFIKKTGTKTPLFIDLIIKITISRAYANNKNKKLLTAEKILECAKTLINFLNRKKLTVSLEEREEAPVIPIDILK